MQDKILGAIKVRVESAGRDFVQNTHWANTGRVYVQPKGAFETLFGFYYSFQDLYATVRFYGKGDEPIETILAFPEAGEDYHYLLYSDSKRIQELLIFVGELLAKVKT